MRGRKLYQALGLSPGASQDEIKKAFRKLAREHHPDRNPGDEAAERRFKEINAANEVLGDPKKRELYDKYGEVSLQPGFDPSRAGGFPGGGFAGGGVDIDDLLGSLFGAGGGRRRSSGGGPSPFGGFPGFEGGGRGADTRASLRVDFLTAALGGQREVTFGDGRRMKVGVPPGVRDGETLRLRGKGRASRGGGPPGDLLLEIAVDAHPHFTRDGDDLTIQVPLTVPEAVRGARVRVPTLDGAVRLRVPPGARTGQRLRVRGKGIARRGGRPGDLFAELVVVPPSTLDDDTLAALEAAYDEDVRAHLPGAAARAPT